jgi:hypothetical protein
VVVVTIAPVLGAGSSAVLAPEAETVLLVASLRTEADGGTVIGMTRTLGRACHVVTRLVDGTSRYDVRTPSSTASCPGKENVTAWT